MLREETTRIDGKDWIAKSRLQCFASRTTGFRTTETFWNWVIDAGQLEIRRKGRRTYIEVVSLRRYLGVDHGQDESRERKARRT